MRAVPLLVAGVFASTATSALVWAAIEWDHRHTPGYEVVEHRLIITSASTPLVHRSVEDTLRSLRPASVNAEAAIADSEYHLAAEAWFSRSQLFSTSRERAARTVFTQGDGD
ncbi:MAG: hypothetical protein AAF266_03735, partial [Planctomycetota bacterium]